MIVKAIYMFGFMVGSIIGFRDIEHPKFELKSSNEGEYEIRLYSPNIAIQTSLVENNNSPFMKLARYIGVMGFPQNVDKKKIAMTAPVIQLNLSDKSEYQDLQFILPSEETNPPLPIDGSGVTLVRRDSKLMAVRTFSGRWDESDHSEKDKLLELLARDNIEIMEPMICEVYQYDPPWTLPNMRTNEVAIQLVN